MPLKRRKKWTPEQEQKTEAAIEQEFNTWMHLCKGEKEVTQERAQEFIENKKEEMAMKTGIGFLIFAAIFNFIIGKILQRLWEKHYGPT